ncbi:SDR family oxidoreductase, partial [Arthrobacter sp. H41]|uniref:SDR family oxidoreductase n=1 Tax=Arthrobacter sp. H41 TaxID=1312978 RepID=UPI00047B9527
MRIVVLGATGTMGMLVADLLHSAGHTVVPAMRSIGVDAASGVGLDAAFAGADAVVDCTNFPTVSARRAVRVLGGMTANVVDAAKRAQVRHLVLLSIVSAATPALRRMGYYRGKAAQEGIIAEGGVPYTIVRTTQWFELTATLLSQTRVGTLAFAPRMRSAPIAAASAAEVIAEV